MAALPKVLILVDKNDGSFSASCFDGTWEYLVASLDKLAAVTRPQSLEAAGELLASGDFSSVLVVSPETFLSHSKPYRILRDQVRSFAEHQGGIVLFCGTFSSFIRPTDFQMYFKNEWKLPWTTGDYHRTTFSVNPVFKVQNLDPTSSYRFDISTAELEEEYSQKVLHVRGAPRSAALYITTPESRVESNVFPPTSVHDAVQAPAVFQAYGKGYVGYLGDVNGEEGTSKAILALCGLTPTTSPPTVCRRIPNPKAGGTYCSGCGEQEAPVGQGERYQRCGKCRKCYYCSRKCQKDHWDGGHKKECKYMRDEDEDEDDNF
ncbi:hypothetical protein MMC30_002655 [Trapelia coarctata]|nr:hypothetical protein [Trapelia coarctata]